MTEMIWENGVPSAHQASVRRHTVGQLLQNRQNATASPTRTSKRASVPFPTWYT
jgi:hypothetical protein